MSCMDGVTGQIYSFVVEGREIHYHFLGAVRNIGQNMITWRGRQYLTHI